MNQNNSCENKQFNFKISGKYTGRFPVLLFGAIGGRFITHSCARWFLYYHWLGLWGQLNRDTCFISLTQQFLNLYLEWSIPILMKCRFSVTKWKPKGLWGLGLGSQKWSWTAMKKMSKIAWILVTCRFKFAGI